MVLSINSWCDLLPRDAEVSVTELTYGTQHEQSRGPSPESDELDGVSQHGGAKQGTKCNTGREAGPVFVWCINAVNELRVAAIDEFIVDLCWGHSRKQIG